MQKSTVVLIAIIALLVGHGIGYLVGSKNPHNRNADNVHVMEDGSMMSNNHNMGGAMDAMMAGLEGKTGDEFDKAFINEMIMHHEGAVEMAEMALTNAKRQEIKDMANAIISAQTKEIETMKKWRKAWYNQ